VARSLKIGGLLGLFDTYLTVADALAVLTE
jgi:hypothetical protein